METLMTLTTKQAKRLRKKSNRASSEKPSAYKLRKARKAKERARMHKSS